MKKKTKQNKEENDERVGFPDISDSQSVLLLRGIL